VLKRGLTGDDALLTWLLGYSGDGFGATGRNAEKKLATLTLYDSRGQSVRRWNIRDAMPVRWTGPQFAADGCALAIEELEVCHGGFTVD
jgi:phage tail-like protein